ncbi:MAG: glycoside hydrolase family 5 protein, partial [Clostridiales bacterium]|nr:glycoside hydrolase family 5 protein [Clostridiales bacterium]
AYEMGMCPMLWDANGHYNRLLGTFRDEQLLKNLQEIMAMER